MASSKSERRVRSRTIPVLVSGQGPRSIIRLVENVIPDHGDARATLETMRDEHLKWARTVQPMTARP
ncbi:hypothetical protein [Streptomyces sp. NBC_00893]|uniref:hypothetical protein n=1 Tax=Streptomyces sp. NBC_00893 TaxID=2975862 RepID=UPI00225959A6|nr:hypothetical protein [Streptomyces sp. NBC_00893]MCX4852109.1 hypothetical protein [Streptomyces sp. NBC_00893]